MDQSVATAAGSGPLTAEAARVLDSIDAPVLVVARAGSIAYANDPARLLLTRDDPSRIHLTGTTPRNSRTSPTDSPSLTGRVSTVFLARARATRTPLPGVIAIKRGSGIRRYRCHVGQTHGRTVARQMRRMPLATLSCAASSALCVDTARTHLHKRS